MAVEIKMSDDEKQRLKHVQKSGSQQPAVPSGETEGEIRQRVLQDKKQKEFLKEHAETTTSKPELAPERQDETQVRNDPVKLLNSARLDNELQATIKQYSAIKPHEAIVNKRDDGGSRTTTIDDKTVDRSHERTAASKSNSWKQPINDDRSELGTNVPCDNENFACVLPIPIANKLAEFKTIEPETMIFLQQKFDYLQNRVPHFELTRVADDRSVNSMTDASEHAKQQMKPRRKEPLREARAQKQIDVIQQEIEYCYYLPRIHEYCVAISRCDCRDGYFIFWACQVVGYEKRFHH